jgi:hypothetical protein
MRFLKLRIAWSLGCGILCLLLMVWWLRSYWECSLLHFSVPPDWGGHVLVVDGVVEVAKYKVVGSVQWDVTNMYSEGRAEFNDPGYQYLGFNLIIISPRWYEIDFPLWFGILLVGCCGFSPWWPWPMTFSLRTLLVATTLVAVVLGLIVWMSQAG